MQEELETQEKTESSPEPSPIRYETVPPIRRNGQGKKFLLFLVVLLVIAVIIGGFIFIRGRQQEGEQLPTPTPTEAPSPTPTPQISPTPTGKPTPTKALTPTPTKKATKGLSVRVLNGSGVTGAAKQASDYLSGLGYEIIGVGNAETQDFETTTIQIKQTKQSSLDQLKIDLQIKYSLGTTSATLSATESADAIVTVGKK